MSKETDISHDLRIDPLKDSRETFIPIKHRDLVACLIRWFAITDGQSQSFEDLCDRLQAIFHVEHLSALIGIDELYGPLDPDSELIQTAKLCDEELCDRTERLFERVASLAYAAHYQRLSRQELQRMIKLGSQRGIKLEVDFEVFDRLEIFARGYRMVEAKRRRWQKFFREETIKLPEFHRLIMTFRLKPEPATEGIDEKKKKKKKKKRNIDQAMTSDAVYIKNFKNIPETDLEVLLPGTKVKFSTLDRGKILLPTITGAAFKAAPTIYKIVRGLLLVGLTATIVSQMEMLAIVAVAMIGYMGKSVFVFFRTKDKYEFNLTKNLYLKNLDNNAGVLYRVLHEAQEQELCETILGYSVLWQQDPNDGLDELELDRLAEEFLKAETLIDVDFDLHDALRKLERLGLATVDSTGLWKAIPIESAAGSLTENWERLFRHRVQSSASSEDVNGDLFTS